ncbi:hypothetical protein Taro_005143 [Colocasia esculenta]|uniref:Plant heme peroxidase family profile domain-containing protein n=1 Tax=Colocasia esculenta TaxID=4460 RepID=A0A843TS11_COLES|nr:hypothetical protein [Colocasia esculenta]
MAARLSSPASVGRLRSSLAAASAAAASSKRAAAPSPAPPSSSTPSSFLRPSSHISRPPFPLSPPLPRIHLNPDEGRILVRWLSGTASETSFASDPGQLKSARDDIKELLKTKFCHPILIRLGWHDAGTYDKNITEWPKRGGANGSLRFEVELKHGANAGLINALKLLQSIKDKYPDITYADLFQLASATAVEAAEGPKIPMKYGRVDVSGPKQCPEEGRLPSAGPPSPAAHLREVFYRMGFDDKGIVALSGAHTLGRSRPDRSGWGKPETKYTYILYVFFTYLSGLEFSRDIEFEDYAGGDKASLGKKAPIMELEIRGVWARHRHGGMAYVASGQATKKSKVVKDMRGDGSLTAEGGGWCSHKDGPGAPGGQSWTAQWLKFDNSYFKDIKERKDEDLLVLPTDAVLFEDPSFKVYAEKYAADQDAFFEDYAEAHAKLSNLGAKFDPPEASRMEIELVLLCLMLNKNTGISECYI